MDLSFRIPKASSMRSSSTWNWMSSGLYSFNFVFASSLQTRRQANILHSEDILDCKKATRREKSPG